MGKKLEKMPTRLHKNRKKRGHVSAGHGRVGKHRKHPGGRNMAGSKHHHKILVNRFHPGYFGKKGMRYFHKLNNRYYNPVTNIKYLWSLIGENARLKFISDNLNTPIIDTNLHGYFKILSKGNLQIQPVIVKAKFFSKKSEAKILKSGG